VRMWLTAGCFEKSGLEWSLIIRLYNIIMPHQFLYLDQCWISTQALRQRQRNEHRNMLWLLVLLFVIPSICLIIYFALSSCLGNGLRGRIPRPSYGRTYLNSISSGAWENIEMTGIQRDSDAVTWSDSEDGGVSRQP